MNPHEVKQCFPIMNVPIYGKRLVYLDNAATAQKPVQVIEALEAFYRMANANVHRGVHYLGAKATDMYEAAREKVRTFIRASEAAEIVFTRGTTSALNLIASGYGRLVLCEGDEIVISLAEHHSNLIPWQQAAKAAGATLKFIPLQEDGTITPEAVRSVVTPRTKIAALHHISNVLGDVVPLREIAGIVHAHGGVLVVDGAQGAPHSPVDVGQMDCDFYVFSGHKMCGPTGIGVLYGKRPLLEQLVPVEYGGEMVESVDAEWASWKELPYRLEAGTPLIAGAIGLGAAIDFLAQIGMEKIERHDRRLVGYALERLQELKECKVLGPLRHRTSILTFQLGEIHPHDLATVLDAEGIAIRAGYHCAQPLAKWFGQAATARASFYLYNTEEDVDALILGLKKAQDLFRRNK
ncbi:SufS family cysteine desulfurase [Brevibacillus borstelensis]|uniref:SufS family cysteine desulfurase n=1 Tax=Brevibacillus borstelensis TaxID=45462 RepID=UPI0004F2E105|nr:SufS family cysteine desulfurase [Brevibacillus borstelensis]KKX54307.1 cysteine desulfurase [Brevibacillus borstelensis cifa_chp40]